MVLSVYTHGISESVVSRYAGIATPSQLAALLSLLSSLIMTDNGYIKVNCKNLCKAHRASEYCTINPFLSMWQRILLMRSIRNCTLQVYYVKVVCFADFLSLRKGH